MKKIILTAALLACGITAAQAAQISVSGGAVAGRVDGFILHQTPQGLDGDVMDKSYSGLQASAGVTFDALHGAVFGLNAMKSTGGADISDLSASAGYAFQVSRFVLTPGLQIGRQDVMGQSYTRRALTLGAAYSISPQWAVMASVGVGRVNGTRNALMQRTDGSYRAGQVGVIYSPPHVGTFTLSCFEQVTQTANLPGFGDLEQRNRAVSLSYSRTF